MPDWVEYLLRILLSLGLGFVIGVERQLRLKVAGIRTHAVVAAGACLFMIVSKYGFPDTPNFDSARVASQVVSGISFIGAGMIIHRQQAVHGLTSAAGIWFTAAIGMAAGAGMYIISAGATALIISIQLFLHLPLKLFKEKHFNDIRLVFVSPDEQCQEDIKKTFSINSFTELTAERHDGDVVFKAVVRTSKFYDDVDIRRILVEHPYILSLQQTESER